MGVIGRPALANFRAKVPSMCPTKRVISTNDPHTGRGGERSRCTICGESGGYCCTVVGNTEGVHVHYTFSPGLRFMGVACLPATLLSTSLSAWPSLKKLMVVDTWMFSCAVKPQRTAPLLVCRSAAKTVVSNPRSFVVLSLFSFGGVNA